MNETWQERRNKLATEAYSFDLFIQGFNAGRADLLKEMEYKMNNNKFFLGYKSISSAIILLLLAIFLASCIDKFYNTSQANNIKTNTTTTTIKINPCKNIKYGDKFIVMDGFYKGLKVTAISVDLKNEIVIVKLPDGQEKKANCNGIH